MALETIEDIVASGVEAQALIDRHLAKTTKAAADLIRVTERGVEEGMVRGIEAKRVIAAARAGAGKIADAALFFAELHQIQTDICKANGADLGDVTTAGGVAIGGVSPMGGGR